MMYDYILFLFSSLPNYFSSKSNFFLFQQCLSRPWWACLLLPKPLGEWRTILFLHLFIKCLWISVWFIRYNIYFPKQKYQRFILTFKWRPYMPIAFTFVLQHAPHGSPSSHRSDGPSCPGTATFVSKRHPHDGKLLWFTIPFPCFVMLILAYCLIGKRH